MPDRRLADALAYYPTSMLSNQHGTCLAKRVDIAAGSSGLLRIERLDFSGQVIRTFDDMAVMAVVATLAGRFGEQSFGGAFACRYAHGAMRLAIGGLGRPLFPGDRLHKPYKPKKKKPRYPVGKRGSSVIGRRWWAPVAIKAY